MLLDRALSLSVSRSFFLYSACNSSTCPLEKRTLVFAFSCNNKGERVRLTSVREYVFVPFFSTLYPHDPGFRYVADSDG